MGKGRVYYKLGSWWSAGGLQERGEHSKSCHLGTHSISIYDVTNPVLVIEEAKGNER